MDKYTLYLDESETANFNKETQTREHTIFTIAGVICKNDDQDSLKAELNQLKAVIWNPNNNDSDYEDKILHELEMSRAITNKEKQLSCEYNRVFKNIHVYNRTYEMLTKIFEESDIKVLAVCIDEDNLSYQYDRNQMNDRFQIAMHMIIENYFHFLNSVDGVGNICYESLPKNQNERIMKRFNGIKYNGTMFYPAKVINSRIKHLEFHNKKENLVGLQLADFVPNALGRSVLKKTYHNKERNIDIEVLRNKLYDGGIDMKEKFGMKIIP